jgi:hypothetical protein
LKNPSNLRFKAGSLLRLRYDESLASSDIVAEVPYTNLAGASEEFFHYYVGLGKSSLSRCRSCFQRIPKDALRVKTHMKRIFFRKFIQSSDNSYKGLGRSVGISFCLNHECVTKAIRKYDDGYLKPYFGIIWVSPKDKPYVPDLPEVTWKIQPIVT